MAGSAAVAVAEEEASLHPSAHRFITLSSDRHHTRASVQLTAQEDLLLRRTSLVLSSSSGVAEAVLSQSELSRLRQFGSKYFGRHRAQYQTASSPSQPHDDHIPATEQSTEQANASPLPNELTEPLHEGEQDPPWLADLRTRLRVVVKRDWFRAAVYAVVMIDMVVLAMDNEYYSGEALARMDVACTLLLLLEVALKALAFGLYSGPQSYLGRSRFRFVNVALLLASLLSHLAASSSQWKVLRGLKMARSLTLYAGLRRILKALARAVPFLANVGTLSLFGLLAFSIFGLEAYNGSYDSQCAAEVVSNASSSSGELASAVLAALPRVYCSSNASCPSSDQFCYAAGPPSANINFDSGVRALFLVFLVVAQDGWVTDIMEPVVEATSAASILFFVAIVASMVFLVVNLFVAVITTAFMNFTVDDETDDGRPRCMGKMDPDVEETHVNMIMGATLVLEESLLASERKASADTTLASTRPPPVDEEIAADHPLPTEPQDMQQRSTLALTPLKVRPSSAPPSMPAGGNSTLLRLHQWQSLRNLTVDTTIRLIHDGFPVEQLAEALAAARPSLVVGTNTPVTSGLLLEGEVLARQSLKGHRSSGIRVPGFMDSASPQVTASSDALVLASADMGTNKQGSRSFAAFQRLVLSKRFDDGVTLCIAANTFFLLVEYEGMGSTLTDVLSVTEYLFGGLFLAEMLARIAAMRGLRNYLRSTERVFDAVVVVCTSVNMLLSNVSTTTNSGLHSVSSLRTLRVGRLMMKYEGTRKLIESILKSSRGVVDVVVFMLLFQVVNSIIGMQLFGGGRLRNEDETPRWNFDTFGRSFLTLLQVITGDQWSSIAYDAVNASDPHWFMVPFLVINFVVGQYVLLNLFIAVILENFSISEEEAYQLQLAQIIAVPKELDIYEKIEEVGVRAFGELEQLDNVSNVKLRMFLGLDDHHAASQQHHTDGNLASATDASATGTSAARYRHPATSKSSWISRLPFGDELADRWVDGCTRVATNAWFSRLVQLMILSSCICLVLDDPHPHMSDNPPSAEFTRALKVVNRVVLAVLVLEFVVKVGSSGFGLAYLRVAIFHKDEQLGYVPRQAYMEDKWNQLDLALLIITVADEVVTVVSPSVSIARVFRAGRVLRPLRMLNKNREMKLILGAVAQSLPQVGNVLAVCLIVYIIFSVVGRSLFAGKFYSCNDTSVALESECIGFFPVTPDGALALQEAASKGVPGGAILVPRVWANARFSFDNVGAGFLTLLEMTSLKWIDKTFAAMDIAGKGKQPVENHSTEFAAFFVLYVYMGSLFVVRLFVGVLVEQFQRNNGTEMLTESQKSWVDLEKFILLLKPLKRIPRPRAKWQARVYDLCLHPYFTAGVSVAILLNVVLLLVSPSSKSESSVSFTVIEILFLTVFSLEAGLKCVGLRQHYLLRPNGAFEVLILSGSLVAYFFATGYHAIIQAGRVFRMLRVLRFVNLNRGVYTVFQTFRASLRPIGQIFFLMFLIFATVARQFFGGVRFGSSMNRFSNFRSFGSSVVLLFQIMSGDDWHLTMTDCMADKPFCVELTDTDGTSYSDCGSSASAAFFFVTYVVMVVFVFLNLFIAVILENFRSCYLKDDVCAISLRDFEAYREVFMRYDTHGNGVFPLWQLPSFLAELPPSLRIASRTQRAAFLQIRAQAQAQLECAREARRRPYFNELLRILCIHHMGIRSLPYEQQRSRVKQIFIFRSKIARMLVDSVARGYVQRFRMRQARKRDAEVRRAQKQREIETQTVDVNTTEDVVVARTDSGSLIIRRETHLQACNASTQTTGDGGSEGESGLDGDNREDNHLHHHRRRRHRHHDGCRHTDKHRRSKRDSPAKVLPDLALGDGDESELVDTDSISGGANHLQQDHEGGESDEADDGTLVPKRVAEQSGHRRVKLAALPISSKVLPST
jgi:hypothetical protein